MSVEEIIDVPESDEVTIQLPEALKKSKRVKIIFNELDDDRGANIVMLLQAPYANDFMADLYEVHNDFEGIESKIDE